MYSQLDNPEYHSEFTPYRRGNQNPLWPASSQVPTSRNNPIDLTRSSQLATNASTEKQRKDLRQTNAESVRSSPSISTRTSSLSINTPAQQGPVSERAQSHPGEFLSKADQQSELTTQMSELRRSKIKAVAKKSTVSASSTRDVGPNPMLTVAAKTGTRTSPQPPTDQHAERPFEGSTNDSEAGNTLQSKNIPPPAKLRKVFDQSFPAKGSPQSASTTDKCQISTQPSFVKQQKNTSLLFDNYESPDKMARSAQSSPSDFSTVIGKPVFKRVRPQPSPDSGKLSVQQPAQQPAAAPNTQQTLNNDPSKVSSSQRELCDLSFFPTRLLIKDSLGKL